MDIKIVIGAQYGDEGKGRTVDLFTRDCINGDMAVVMTNGGAQRGHTVTKGNRTHIFHHFGSGTLNGADTIMSKDFKVNPILFREEWNELYSSGIIPKVYVDHRCSINIPWDSIINQCWEASLGDDRFGSCGIGIYESIVRCKKPEYDIKVSHILDAKNSGDWSNVYNMLNKIYIEWVPARIKQVMGNRKMPDIFAGAFEKNIIPIFIDDIRFFIEHVSVILDFSELELNEKYKRIVFENAQGLAISQEYYQYGENTTPTITGVKSALDSMNSMNLKDEYSVEICYVTRWYTTRHGAGYLPGETDVRYIGSRIVDDTNVYNEWQGNIRYAPLSIDTITYRIMRDLSNIDKSIFANVAISLSVNCIDQNESNDICFMMNGRNMSESVSNMCQLILCCISPIFKSDKNNTCYLGYGKDSEFTKRIYI